MTAVVAPLVACLNCGSRKPNRPRGLCWRCYYTPGVATRHQPLDLPQNRRGHGTPAEHAASADLFLVAWLAVDGRTGLQLDEWRRVLAHLHPKPRLAVVLTLLWDWPLARIGQELGVTRSRAEQLLREAERKLAERVPDLVAKLGG